MTPAIESAKKARVAFTTHTYTHDESAASYGLEAAEKLGVAPEHIFKNAGSGAGWKASGGGHCAGDRTAWLKAHCPGGKG